MLKVEIAFATKEFQDCCKALSSIPAHWKSIPPSRTRTKCRASHLRAWECRFQDQSAKRDGLAKIRSFSHTTVIARDPAHPCSAYAACASLAPSCSCLLPGTPDPGLTGNPGLTGIDACRATERQAPTSGDEQHPEYPSQRTSQSRLTRVKALA